MSYREGFGNSLAGFQYLQDQADQGTARRKENTLAQLAGNYASGGQPDYQGIAANGGDPLAFRKDAQGQQDRRKQELGQMAGYLAAMPPEARPSAYAAMLPKLAPIGQEMGLPPLPPAWDESHLPELEHLAQQYGNGGADPYKPMNVSPGGEIVNPRTGEVIHSNTNFAPQKPVWSESRGGFALPPGQASAPPSAQPRNVQFDFAPGTPQSVIDATQAYAAADQGGQPQGSGFVQVAPPRPEKPNYEADRIRLAQEAADRAKEASRRASLGNAPAGMRFNAKGDLEPIPGAPAAASATSKADESAAAMAQDAINYAAAMLGKKPEDVAKMTPEAIRTAIAKDPRLLTGPVGAGWWGSGKFANADLEAYANSAAGKKARLNNPTGPVSNADFEIGRKSVFSPEKPASVNADLIYQALTWKKDKAAPAALDQLSVDELLQQLGAK